MPPWKESSDATKTILPRPRGEHVASELARQHELGVQVHLDNPIPELVWMLGSRRSRDRSGVVDEDVDLDVAAHVGHEVVHGGAIGEIAAMGTEAPALSFDRPRDVAARFERRADTDDIGTRGGETHCRGFADPTTAAGDERGPSGEVER